MNRPIPFDMFFYGTLKRGQRNHPYCRGASRVCEATVEGSLYELPEGYPALVVPGRNILAVGTADPLRDAETRRDLRAAPEREGSVVFGELYTFDHPEETLPSIDFLEGFVAGDVSSLYRRVLIPARTEGGATAFAWAYVIREARGAHVPTGRWPT